MIWLASFPRSGNTFFRNVLHEVYGIKSSTYHKDPTRDPDRNFASYPVVKTHLLPKDLPKDLRDKPAVYLVRDGRDALSSIAHHRKDIVAPGTDWYTNLLEAILAQQGSFFGGWSENVARWAERATIVIRFEDLIADPIGEVEKLRAIMDLPEPDRDRLPTFKDLKFGRPAYGGGKGAKFSAERVAKHFRAGKVGGWRGEYPPELLRLANVVHGATLDRFGYPDALPAKPYPKRSVMLEATKLYGDDNDGVKRYLAGLVNGFAVLLPYLPHWKIELYDSIGIMPLKTKAREPFVEFTPLSEKEVILSDRRTMGYEKRLLLIKSGIKKLLPAGVYDRAAVYYHRGPFRPLLDRIKRGAHKVKAVAQGGTNRERLGAADLVHLSLPQHYNAVDGIEVPTLVTVHDITHRLTPEFHDHLNVKLAERGMKALLKKSAHFLSVSAATDRDLQAAYQPPAERSHMVYEAADADIFHPQPDGDIAAARSRYGIPDGPYLMCLSTIEPRKNLRNTIRAFVALKEAHPELTAALVVCGKHGWKTEEIFDGLDLERPDLVFTGFVADMDLPLLYANATALCYASHYEGFGLPLLEAMACGTPVIYGNNSSQPEVAAAGGVPVDPNDVDGIRTAMHLLLTDEERRNELAKAAWRQSNKFSWIKTALQTLEVYEEIISAGR